MKSNNIYKIFMFLLAAGLVWSCGDDDDTTTGPTVEAPVAAFSAAPNELTIVFMNNSINATSFEWDFGDGSAVNTEENPTYTYAAAGDYTVTLVARNADGDSNTVDVTFSLSSANEKVDLLVGSEGRTWKLVREGTAVFLASDPDLTQIWWPGSSNNGERPCYFDDSFTFAPDGTFAFDDAGTFWAEAGVFNGIADCDQNTVGESCFDATPANLINECGDDVSAWLSNDSHSFTFDADNNTVTLSGLGVWMGFPKLGTAGESIVPVSEVTFNANLIDGGGSGVDTMIVTYDYPGMAFWPFTYVSYDDPADEPALVTSFEPPACEPLASIAPMDISHSFESASSTNLLEEIVEAAADIEYGVADPADPAAAPVSRYIRTVERFQELQFRINSGNAIDFSNMSSISLDVYLPSTNIYGDGALNQNVFVGFGATTCPPLWWMDLHQYQAEGIALDEWVTVTFDLSTPNTVAIPDNGATVFDRNDKDMIFIQIGGGDHVQDGEFFIRNFSIQ